MRAELTSTGAIRRLNCGPVALSLFVGNEVEGSVGNLYLRRLGTTTFATPLLGPSSPTVFAAPSSSAHAASGSGHWQGIDYTVSLVLAQNDAAAWFWHVALENRTDDNIRLDLTYAQDLALASYGGVRLNEFYVSQYIDHTPLTHPQRGILLASRQNQALDGRHPWSLVGSLRRGVSFATDALQFHGLASRAGAVPTGLTGDLPSRRLQHEHALAVIRDEPVTLKPGTRIACGFVGGFWSDHPQATSESTDTPRLDELLRLPEAQAPSTQSSPEMSAPAPGSWFTTAPLLPCVDLDPGALARLFPQPWRHVERGHDDVLLSFFHGPDHRRHVVLRAKERQVLRPHGHLLRSGDHLTPDESALTTTAWMAGVFQSMTTQGHVSINRLLSTVHGYLGLFRSHGLRIFVEVDSAWQLLDVPSAFEMAPSYCRWIYRYGDNEIHVRSEALGDSHELGLCVEFVSGPPRRCLLSHHVALNGDDGSTPGPARWRRDGEAIVLQASPDSDVGRRFPDGRFRIEPTGATRCEQVGGDELLYRDGASRNEPFLCIVTAPAERIGLRASGHLVAEDRAATLHIGSDEALIPSLHVRPGGGVEEHAQAMARLAEIVPWFTHNALVHYLSPRGLEQYSGGGWGTRDVCQGPVELLLAQGRVAPIRDLLLRVMRQQNPDGDWPQWFMFFDRERGIRPGDSHGDIVFWPLLALGQYLVASGDATVLDERVSFFDGPSETVWTHVQRALTLIAQRVIPGTSLAAYGHGDWNDSLQPADPSLRESLCSAWTVTLHAQMLTTLAQGLRAVDRAQAAEALEQQAEHVRRDFQRWLVADGVLTGYADFGEGATPRYLLHPRDETTGVRFSALAMVHAILEDLLTPEQTRDHLRLLQHELSGPDGLRLFDRPLPYRGGPQRLFQRAETATNFGREIGLMYMHAHLRYAQALAHVGDADGFFRALCQVNPIGLQSVVPTAAIRQANCYYSSSDAAFDDRYQASDQYERVKAGTIALEGGWRVYSSGAGIALGLIVRRLLGLSVEGRQVCVDPVMPAALDGLHVHTQLLGRPLEIVYAVRDAGCGVKALSLNDAPLMFSRAHNPHRPGAARIDRAELGDRLSATSQNVLRVDLG